MTSAWCNYRPQGVGERALVASHRQRLMATLSTGAGAHPSEGRIDAVKTFPGGTGSFDRRDSMS